MIERTEFDTMPPEPDRLAWCEWARWHGIDPSAIAIPGWIERDTDARRIQYEAHQRDEHGHCILDVERDEVLRVVQVQQLEAVPSPFPR